MKRKTIILVCLSTLYIIIILIFAYSFYCLEKGYGNQFVYNAVIRNTRKLNKFINETSEKIPYVSKEILTNLIIDILNEEKKPDKIPTSYSDLLLSDCIGYPYANYYKNQLEEKGYDYFIIKNIQKNIVEGKAYSYIVEFEMRKLTDYYSENIGYVDGYVRFPLMFDPNYENRILERKSRDYTYYYFDKYQDEYFTDDIQPLVFEFAIDPTEVYPINISTSAYSIDTIDNILIYSVVLYDTWDYDIKREVEYYMDSYSDIGFSDFLYFSIVTITTLGYGDIIPNCSEARTLISIEAVLGTLMMGIFVSVIFIKAK